MTRAARAARTTTRALATGLTAHRALAAAGGCARVLARPGGAAFLTAGAEIVWLGPASAPLHPRAVLVASVPGVEIDEDIRIDLAGCAPWQPAAAALDGRGVIAARASWRALIADVRGLGTPSGFGTLLTGAPLAFPLDGAGDHARALAEACTRDHAVLAEPAMLALLGLGGGLTPSGDDFVGGALFARQWLAAAGLADAHAWRAAAASVCAAAPSRTHPISAALLGDLARGCGHAPLHDLAAALAAGRTARARHAAAALVRLGHSSGWDMLAGFGTGLADAG
jgi:Protein of unknown function (DUF2877)